MKYIVNIIMLVSFVTLTSCSGMNDIIEEYLDRGEINYIGRPDSITCDGGLYRVKFTWKVGKDVRIESCKIFWNMGADSLIYPIDKESLINGYASVELPFENEGEYVFDLVQMGEKGFPSIPQEVIGKVYGDKYISSLIPRSARSVDIENNVATLTISSVDNCYYSEVLYTDNNGKENIVRVEPDVTSITIDNYTFGGDFTIRSYYKPEENAIDIFEVEDKGRFPLVEKLNRGNWTIPFVSSQKEDTYPITNILDGNVNSLWHSKWTPSPPAPFPHIIVIDMAEEFDLYQLQVFQDPARMTFKSARILVAETNEDDESFVEIGTMHCLKTDKSSIFDFTKPQKARYIKMIMEESYNPPYVAISEIYAYGR